MIDYNDIDTDGITNITLDDVKYAAAMDSVIKLIGYAQFDENGKVYSIVSPMVIKTAVLLPVLTVYSMPLWLQAIA